MAIKIYNSLSKRKEDFVPIDSNNIKMYVCGPTVYNTPHIGNIRSAVVYDLVFRVLIHYYKNPKNHKKNHKNVTYVRNITDVDDKIIDAAKQEGKSCNEISEYYTDIYHNHLSLLNCLSPTIEPKATENIDQIIKMIQQLIANGNAYIANGHVYFDVMSFESYGELSGRNLSDLVHGARVEVEPNKRNPGDFVLWKPDSTTFWPSPWGNGRPGWHIECSAMSIANLGENFDIHGGGADLKFPHHENEIAQSCAAHPGSIFAKYWIHNGFLTVNGEKMSKSLGNIVNLDHLIEANITPNIVRFIFLNTHYSKPLNWNDTAVEDARNSLMKFKISIINNQDCNYSNTDCSNPEELELENFHDDEYYKKFVSAITDDFNSPGAISVLHEINEKINEKINQNNNEKLYSSNKKNYSILLKNLLGLLGINLGKIQARLDENFINLRILERNLLKSNKEYEKADLIRTELNKLGIIIQDKRDGKTSWFAL